MKHTFVLDENILILALKGEDARGREDYSCAQLIRKIQGNCHRVGLSQELAAKYSQQMDAYKRAAVPKSMDIPKVFFRGLVLDQGKCVYSDAPPALTPQVAVPAKDRFIVALAAALNGPLVTTDEPLKDSLRSQSRHLGIPAVLGPDEALPLAQEQGP